MISWLGLARLLLKVPLLQHRRKVSQDHPYRLPHSDIKGMQKDQLKSLSRQVLTAHATLFELPVRHH
jgi:hypothetical protein